MITFAYTIGTRVVVDNPHSPNHQRTGTVIDVERGGYRVKFDTVRPTATIYELPEQSIGTHSTDDLRRVEH